MPESDAHRRLKAVIVDRAPTGIITIDLHGRVVEFNPAAEVMFGRRRSDAIGRFVDEMILAPEHRMDDSMGVQRLKWGREPRLLESTIELTALRGDGSRFPVEMVIRRTDLDEFVHYTAYVSDVGERVRTAETAERQRDVLRNAERLGTMGSMLASVAHELNNPLAILMGRVTLLEEKISDPALADDLASLADAAGRCGRIVRTFLDMARGRPSERRPLVVNELVQGAIDLLRYGLRSHGIQLELALATDLPAVTANADQIGQIVLNLLVNAQQALSGVPEPRRLSVSTGVEPVLPDGRLHVWLRIADNGPGVPAGRRDGIFEPFFTTKPRGEGLGLGLALSRALAREVGGDLKLEDRGPGACFKLNLPLTAPASTAVADGAVAGPSTIDEPTVDDESPATARLLVVDDEPQIAELMRGFLEAAGYEVAVAESGAVALEILEEARFDAIVSDLRMPDVDGAALWRALASRWPALQSRMLFVTADALSAGAAEFFARSGRPMLLKPFARDELLAAVSRVLRDG